MSSDLKTKTFRGLIWTSIQKFGTMLISFVSNIILARLLMPSDFGCIGMLAIFISVADVIVDGGFGAALIQKRNPTREDYSTMFYWNLFLSFALYGLLYLSAPYIARFYNMPILSDLLKVEGVVLIISGLGMVQRNQLRKKMHFDAFMYINLTSSILSVIVAIVMAYNGCGVWSLVAQQLVMVGISTLLFVTTNRWRPSLVFSKKSFKELFSFGSFLLLSNFVNKLSGSIQGILIGKFYTPSTMGLYSQGSKLESITAGAMAQVVDQVAYPTLAMLKDDQFAMIAAMRKFKQGIAVVTFPMMICLIVVAKPLIEILFTEKWLGSAPFFQILCIAGMASCLQAINYYVVMSLGQSKAIFKMTIIRRTVGIGFMILGFVIGGIWGLMVGMVLSTYFISYTNCVLVNKYLGYSLWKQVLDLMPIFIPAVVAGVSIFLISVWLPFGNVWAILLVSVSLYVVIFIVLTYAFKVDVVVNFRDYFGLLIRKTK